MQKGSAVNPVVRKAYTVEEVRLMLGIGRNSAYKLVHSGKFSLLKVGKSIRISKSSFDSWLDNKDKT